MAQSYGWQATKRTMSSIALRRLFSSGSKLRMAGHVLQKIQDSPLGPKPKSEESPVTVIDCHGKKSSRDRR
jgi:hypothetical protein